MRKGTPGSSDHHCSPSRTEVRIAGRRGASDPRTVWVRTEGPVTPRSHQRLRKLREKAEKAAGLWPWPQNALRHSYISYRLALIEDVAKVALEAGHDPKALAAWYRRPIRKEVAKKFWSILP